MSSLIGVLTMKTRLAEAINAIGAIAHQYELLLCEGYDAEELLTNASECINALHSHCEGKPLKRKQLSHLLDLYRSINSKVVANAQLPTTCFVSNSIAFCQEVATIIKDHDFNLGLLLNEESH